MSYLTEKRKYQRCDTSIGKTLLSKDSKHWENIELSDISAGGLRFVSSKEFQLNTHLYFDICLYNMLSEFNLKFEAVIVRTEKSKERNVYAVKFENVNKYTQIQLDELIKSKISVANFNQPQPDFEEGVYTFLLIPRTRTRRRLMLFK